MLKLNNCQLFQKISFTHTLICSQAAGKVLERVETKDPHFVFIRDVPITLLRIYWAQHTLRNINMM